MNFGLWIVDFATEIALRFPPSARLASLTYSVRFSQDSETRQDSASRQGGSTTGIREVGNL
ncbi:hypothetical protein C7B77_02660 [Chamaesiphon polymorphus CCALA 037]|uniref:Uncharacterized protein n=1 Tax=Chamaesiphon polymorphus CCALA 037 TaxID=2107692 RepID=A0A2T1GMA2_9CYAN|nr:hypothetical protein C7B77_02660 [Chamaesiphon polymorphus CCALA 037]